MRVWIKNKFWFLFADQKCEWCGKKLRRFGDHYYGGIEVNDTIGGTRKRVAQVCNLCYQFYYSGKNK